MPRTRFWNSTALAGALFALAGAVYPLRAQDQDPDDLKRGVARISLMNGDVNVRRGDSGDWVAGVINAPLMTGDRIASGPSSRAEVEFDASNAIRIGANAELHLAQLEYGRYQLELSHGLVTFRILRQNDVNIEIDTPSISVRPSRQGSVRILVSEAGETEVTSRGGDVEVFTPHGSQWIRSGQTLLARGSSADPEFQVVAAGGLDDWDRWSDSRDAVITQSTSSRYVGDGIYGAEDLDNYGNWETVPEYGPVWRPTVAADWTPYYYGRWAWQDWYGWTWISSDPWGWAPYHYGRWFRDDHFGWCWYPGLRTGRHYWSPALVGFIGFGGGGGIGFGFGNVGWVPLAPHETYNRWWGRNWYRSGGYYNHQVNFVNVNISNNYRNSRHNGIVSVGYRDFEAGRFNRVERHNSSQIREGGSIRGAMPFAPGAQNRRYSDRAVTNVPRVNENTRFFRSQQANSAQRVPAGGQQTQSPQGSFRGQSGPAGGNSNSQTQNGWRRFGQTGGNTGASPATGSRVERVPAQQQPSQAAPRQDTRAGWQRFGSTGSDQRQPPPSQAAPRQSTPQENRGGGQRFGGAGNRGDQAQPQREAQPQTQPQQRRQEYMNQPRGYSGYGGGSNRQESIRVAPPVVRERPSYSEPRNSSPRQSAPSYSAPRQSAPSRPSPSYSAPRQSAPSRQEAPRSNGGGGGGGGGGRPSGGGGGGNRRGR